MSNDTKTTKKLADKLIRCTSLLSRSLETMQKNAMLAEIMPEQLLDMSDEELCVGVVQSEYAYLNMSDEELSRILLEGGADNELVKETLQMRREEKLDNPVKEALDQQSSVTNKKLLN